MLKKRIVLSAAGLFICCQLFGQEMMGDKQVLRDLLDARRIKFSQYSELIERKSGIFGNKTKKDIQLSHDVLIEIVETDNRIISTLNRVIDFRTTEKVNRNYETIRTDERLINLQRASDTLSSQVRILTLANSELKGRGMRWKYLSYFLALSTAVLFLLLFRRK